MKINIINIVLSILSLDQISKRLISYFVSKYSGMKLFSFMNFTQAWNKGVSFSLLSNVNASLLTILSTIITIYLCYLLFVAKRKFEQVGLACIVGGAVSNIIDRVCFGKVFDFISVHYYEWHFPVFNVADIFICLGAFFLFIDLLSGKTKSVSKPKS